jgi:hypothetical protein
MKIIDAEEEIGNIVRPRKKTGLLRFFFIGIETAGTREQTLIGVIHPIVTHLRDVPLQWGNF